MALGGFKAYLQKQRLRRAWDALRAPELRHLPISEIAQLHGFANPESFTRNFRSLFNLNSARSAVSSRARRLDPSFCETSDRVVAIDSPDRPIERDDPSEDLRIRSLGRFRAWLELR